MLPSDRSKSAKKRTPNRGKERKGPDVGSERGTGPAATPVSPAARLAGEIDQPSKSAVSIRAEFHAAAVIEASRWDTSFPDFVDQDEDSAAAAEIEAMYQVRLMSLRRLPRHERPYALQAAREWRQLAMKALREKSARERRARHMAWRLQRPAPRPPG
jgi:hypothetical protein